MTQSRKSAFFQLYGETPDPQLVDNVQNSDDVARENYLAGLRSYAPVNWYSDHLREGERLRGAVYVAIKCLEDQAAASELMFYRWSPDARLGGDQDAKQPLERSHPLVKLMNRPNNHDSRGVLLRRMIQNLCLTGSSILWRIDDGFGMPVELWSVPTGTYQPGPISTAYPEGYYTIMPWFPGPLAVIPNSYSTGGVKVDSRHILVTRRPHPLIQQEGQSPLQACDLALDTIESIDRARFSKMRRGLNPGAVVELDPQVKYPDPNELARIRQQLFSLVGGADRAGNTAILSGGMKMKTWGDSDIEIGWVDSWNQLTSFVLSIFGVTKSLAFMTEETSYAALYAALQQFNLFSLCPLLHLITDSFNHQLVHPFFGEDIFMELVPKKVNDDEMNETRIANDNAVGARTINEIRTMRGLEQVPWGEERAWTKGATAETDKDKAPQEDPKLHKLRPDNEAANGSLPNRRIL